jgi:hypothetical protein
MVEIEFEAHCAQNPDHSDWLSRTTTDRDEFLDQIEALPPVDIRRLSVLNPALMRDILRSRRVHVDVSMGLKVLLDCTMIQRSLASTLPVSEGEPISLRPLFKRVTRKTAIIQRYPEEELEYQYFHREAAK